MKSLFSLVLLGFMLVTASVHATEATAGASINLVETWGMLTSQVRAATAKSILVDSRITQIALCHSLNKLYAPGAGADGSGCIPNSKIVQLQNSIAASNKSISDIRVAITGINTKMANLDTQITTVQGTVTGLSNQIAGMVTLSSDLNAKATAALNSINDLNNRMTVISGQIATLSNTANTHSSQIADLYNKLTGINAQIAAVNNSITASNNQLNSINSTTATLGSYISNVLYCGANNMVYNSNVGCVVPSGHATCTLYRQSDSSSHVHTVLSGQPSPGIAPTLCPAGTYGSLYATGAICNGGSPNGTDHGCNYTYYYHCFALSC